LPAPPSTAWDHATQIVNRLNETRCRPGCTAATHHRECPRVLVALQALLRLAPWAPLGRPAANPS